MRIVVLTEHRKKPFPQKDVIIGQLILDEYIVEIDFDENVLKLYDPFSFEPDEGWEPVSLKIDDDLPIMEAFISIGNEIGIPVLLFVDIVARISLMIKADPSKK